MNCIVVDDDEFSLKATVHCVERTDFLTLSGVFTNPVEAIMFIRENKDIDLIFLDIEMPEMTGLDFIRTLTDIPQIILVTGNKEYAVEAFDYDITDFLLKPVDYARFLKAALKAKEIKDGVKISQRNTEDLFIKRDSQLVRINSREIIWIEAMADYVTIHTTSAKYTILSTMKSIESRLPADDFARIHRSFIIRLDRIKVIDDTIVFVEDKSFPISRTHRENLFNKLNLL